MRNLLAWRRGDVGGKRGSEDRRRGRETRKVHRMYWGCWRAGSRILLLWVFLYHAFLFTVSLYYVCTRGMCTCDTTLTLLDGLRAPSATALCVPGQWTFFNRNHWLPRGFQCISNGTLSILSVLAVFDSTAGAFLPMSGCTGHAQVWYGLSVRLSFGTMRHTPPQPDCLHKSRGEVNLCLLSIECCWW